MRKELDQLNVAKSGGLDLIPSRYYEVRSSNEEPLSHMFQLLWVKSKLPSDWREAEISASTKKGKVLTLTTTDL